MTTDIPRIATAIIVVIVVIVGGVLAITGDVSWSDYLQGVAIGAGLLGVGLGIDQHSKP